MISMAQAVPQWQPTGFLPLNDHAGSLPASLATAGLRVLERPMIGDAALASIHVNSNGERLVLAAVGGLSTFLAVKNPLDRLIGNTAQQEQKALAFMRDRTHSGGTLQPIAECLAQAAPAQITAHAARTAAQYPASAFLRGTELVLSGSSAARSRFLLELANAATGKRFTDLGMLHEAIDRPTQFPLRNPLLAPWEYGPNRFARISERLSEQRTVLTGSMINPHGYYFRVGRHYCAIRPIVDEATGQESLSIRLSRKKPVDGFVGAYSPPLPLASGKGPTGKSRTHACMRLALAA